MDEVVNEIKKMPRPEQFNAVLKAVDLRLPEDTRVTHFADVHWLEHGTEPEAIESVLTQLDFLHWWQDTTDMVIFFEAMSSDVVEDASEFAARVMSKRRTVTPPGLLAKLAGGIPELDAEYEKIYIGGAAIYLALVGNVSKLYAAASPALLGYINTHRLHEDPLFSRDLREITALIRIEEFLRDHPQHRRQVVLVYGLGHDFEGRFSDIPNLRIETKVVPSVESNYQWHRRAGAAKASADECGARLASKSERSEN